MHVSGFFFILRATLHANRMFRVTTRLLNAYRQARGDCQKKIDNLLVVYLFQSAARQEIPSSGQAFKIRKLTDPPGKHVYKTKI